MRFLIFLAVLAGAAALWAQTYLSWQDHQGVTAGEKAAEVRAAKVMSCMMLLEGVAQLDRVLPTIEDRVAATLKNLNDYAEISGMEQAGANEEERLRNAWREVLSASYWYGFRSFVDTGALRFSDGDQARLGASAIAAIPFDVFNNMYGPGFAATQADFNAVVDALETVAANRPGIEEVCLPLLTGL
ncbi:MAG: hypothetical protein GC152_06255 [Alphaproteobacteria bacterium]|nr:hypothetical protein [Alphaproteobacteria bacterium]